MPRNFRFNVKKRGARRTDSTRLGNFALAAFFGLLFFGGLGFSAYLLSTLVIPEWRVNHRFHQGDCVVLAKRLLERGAGDRKTYRPEMHITYEVDSVTYHSRTHDITRALSADKPSQQAVLDRFEEGKRYPCWYDPNDPGTVVLVRGYTWPSWLLLLLPFSFVIAGGVGLAYTLLHWGMSAERRAMLAQKTLHLDLFDLGTDAPRLYPAVPRGAAQGDSPGTTLAFRLPIDTRRTWALVTLSAISLAVLALASVFVGMAIRSHLAGRPDWLMAVFAGSWVLVGSSGVGYCVRQFLGSAGVGATILEVSDHPLHPGEEYEVFLSQAGHVRVKGLELTLVCEERATYQQGTNTRTDACRVHQDRILHQESVRLRRGRNFEARAAFRIPLRMMHSFSADHNEVLWKLLVTGEVPAGPSFERRFRIVVYPPGEEGQAE